MSVGDNEMTVICFRPLKMAWTSARPQPKLCILNRLVNCSLAHCLVLRRSHGVMAEQEAEVLEASKHRKHDLWHVGFLDGGERGTIAIY
jgi:hypothetical protein